MSDMTVELSQRSTDALDALNIVRVGRVNANLGDMAWLKLVLFGIEDNPEIFPAGKWATIQHIEEQLDRAALAEAERIQGGADGD